MTFDKLADRCLLFIDDDKALLVELIKEAERVKVSSISLGQASNKDRREALNEMVNALNEDTDEIYSSMDSEELYRRYLSFKESKPPNY